MRCLGTCFSTYAHRLSSLYTRVLLLIPILLQRIEKVEWVTSGQHARITMVHESMKWPVPIVVEVVWTGSGPFCFADLPLVDESAATHPVDRARLQRTIEMVSSRLSPDNSLMEVVSLLLRWCQADSGPWRLESSPDAQHTAMLSFMDDVWRSTGHSSTDALVSFFRAAAYSFRRETLCRNLSPPFRRELPARRSIAQPLLSRAERGMSDDPFIRFGPVAWDKVNAAVRGITTSVAATPLAQFPPMSQHLLYWLLCMNDIRLRSVPCPVEALAKSCVEAWAVEASPRSMAFDAAAQKLGTVRAFHQE